MIEGGTPNTLFRRGVNKNSLPYGTAIIVDGYQAKDGTLKGNGRDITFPDGRKLFIGSTGTGAPGDPQPTEVALLVAPVAVGVLQRLLDPAERQAVAALAPAPIALGLGEHLVVPRLGGDPTRYPCHACLSRFAAA